MRDTPLDRHAENPANKKALRRAYLRILKAIPAEARAASDEQIRRHVADMPQFRRAERLFIFVGNGWEVDTWPLIEDALIAGKQVAVPRCLPLADKEYSMSAGTMEACLIHSRRDLRQTAPLGLWEPAEGTPTLPPDSIDFAVIPCIACDTSGRRLGQGGGYYDRFLAGRFFTKAALCRQALLSERLPLEAHDIPVDLIVTEDGVYECLRESPRSPRV